MFDSLSNKLQQVFKNLRGLGKISDNNVSESLREVRMALLDADVNFKVARDFIEGIKQKAIGQQVIQSIQPGQQIIKIIHDELVVLLGDSNSALNLSGNPTSILMAGLHGSGKTTSSGKLARLLLKQGKTPLLVAADVYRPAAMDQLETLGRQIEVRQDGLQRVADPAPVGHGQQWSGVEPVPGRPAPPGALDHRARVHQDAVEIEQQRRWSEFHPGT